MSTYGKTQKWRRGRDGSNRTADDQCSPGHVHGCNEFTPPQIPLFLHEITLGEKAPIPSLAHTSKSRWWIGIPLEACMEEGGGERLQSLRPLQAVVKRCGGGSLRRRRVVLSRHFWAAEKWQQNMVDDHKGNGGGGVSGGVGGKRRRAGRGCGEGETLPPARHRHMRASCSEHRWAARGAGPTDGRAGGEGGEQAGRRAGCTTHAGERTLCPAARRGQEMHQGLSPPSSSRANTPPPPRARSLQETQRGAALPAAR